MHGPKAISSVWTSNNEEKQWCSYQDMIDGIDELSVEKDETAVFVNSPNKGYFHLKFRKNFVLNILPLLGYKHEYCLRCFYRLVTF